MKQSPSEKFTTMNKHSFFVGFALLLVARDVAFDLLISTRVSSAFFALSIAFTISISAAMTLVYHNHFVTSIAIALNKTHRWRVLTLGLASALIYLITFWMITNIGAGLFNLVDYGLTPVITAIGGIVFFHERFLPRYLIATIMYFFGLYLLFINRGTNGINLIALAAISPIATAGSDIISKQLLAAGLSRHAILFVRFFPAMCLLLIFVCVRFVINNEIAIRFPTDIIWLLPFTFVFGYLPLLLLMHGLKHGALMDLAISEVLIPAFCYLLTMSHHRSETRIH